MHKHIIENLTF